MGAVLQSTDHHYLLRTYLTNQVLTGLRADHRVTGTARYRVRRYVHCADTVCGTMRDQLSGLRLPCASGCETF